MIFFLLIEGPSRPYFGIYEQSEGNVDIQCSSQGGRPAPELTMLFDGHLINTTNVPEEDSKRHIKLTHLQRDWNGAKIECCMHHPYYNEPKCSEKEIDYHCKLFHSIILSSYMLYERGLITLAKSIDLWKPAQYAQANMNQNFSLL